MHDGSPLFTPPPKRRPVGLVRRLPAPVLDERDDGPPAALPTGTVCDDAHLITILDAPLRPGETAVLGFARKERELGAAFAEMSILAARALHKRLANPTPGDALAEKFSRLTVERRYRLLNFLADARRRAALSANQARIHASPRLPAPAEHERTR